jgi:AbrB family looped-hinge helix DNA binding protein
MQSLTKIDEKGRLLIPSDIRRSLGLEPGREALISIEGKRAVLSPVFEEKTYELKVTMGDAPGTLAKIADFLSKNKFDIIMSESRSLERERSAEWIVTGKYDGDLSLLVGKLRKLDFVTNVVGK